MIEEIQNNPQSVPVPPSQEVSAGSSEGLPTETTINPLVIEAQVTETIRTCYDPEIPVNIYELGLIYAVRVSPLGEVEIDMTLTSPSCPAAGSLPAEVQTKCRKIPGVKSVKVELVWEPVWSPNNMSEAAKLQLGIE